MHSAEPPVKVGARARDDDRHNAAGDVGVYPGSGWSSSWSRITRQRRRQAAVHYREVHGATAATARERVHESGDGTAARPFAPAGWVLTMVGSGSSGTATGPCAGRVLSRRAFFWLRGGRQRLGPARGTALGWLRPRGARAVGRVPRLRRPGRDADPAGGGRRPAYPLTVGSDRGGCVAAAARVDHGWVRARVVAKRKRSTCRSLALWPMPRTCGTTPSWCPRGRARPK